MANQEYFYDGGYSSLSPEAGNYVGWRIPGAQLGQSMNPSTANQLGETVKTLKTGVQEVEVQLLGSFGGGQDVDQQIPMEHFTELRQLLKLSGARASLHGPLLDPAGFGGQGGADEATREQTEKRFLDAIDKAYELDPDGNIPVVFHSSNGSPGPIYSVNPESEVGDPDERRYKVKQDAAVSKDTGQVIPLNLKEQYAISDLKGLEEEKPHEFTTEDQIASANDSDWKRTMTTLAEYNKHAEEILGDDRVIAGAENAVFKAGKEGVFDRETGKEIDLTSQQAEFIQREQDADIFLQNVRLQFNNAFDDAFNYGTSEQREQLKKLAKVYNDDFKEVVDREKKEQSAFPQLAQQRVLKKAIAGLSQITTEGGAPEKVVSAQEYALEKSSETFSNVAFKAYEKHGDGMPVIAIENVFPGMAFHRAKDLNKLIDKSRDEFAAQLQKNKGMSVSEAKKIAEKHIGATWDVGHINLYKKYGWTDTELVKETQEISRNLKHLHLTDNFGHSDSHLVPGMGNVPIKDHLEQLEKRGVLSKVKKVVEAGGFIQQFSNAGVHGESLAAFGSPIYGMKAGTYWNQNTRIQGNYFGGFGANNPQTHHQTYGSGFTTLPMEIGGSIPGGGSRFSGNQF